MGRYVRRDWNFRSEDPNEHPYTYEQWREATAETCPVCNGKIHLDELGCDTCGNMPSEAPYTEEQMKNLFNAYLNLEAQAKKGSVAPAAAAASTTYSSNSSSYSSNTSSSSKRSSTSGVNWLIFIILLFLFWPGAIVYLIIKSK